MPRISASILLSCTALWAMAADHEDVEKTDSVEVVVDVAVTESYHSERIFSAEITEFENNEIPVDSALFFDHVKSLEFQIPLDYNSEVKRFIDYFGVSWQTKLKEMITLSEYYFPIYESILDKHNLPLELKYVSVIESALNPYATSRSGAVGLWQFMPYTGKLYDLTIDRYQDQRRDVELSTEAACGYFSDMSKQFDDWLVVIASYNCGPGNIRKAIKKAGGKTGFWDIYPYLPSQTQHYIPSFISVAYLMNFYAEYGIFPSEVTMPNKDVTSVVCSPDHHLKAISEILEIPVADIRALNPSLKADDLPSNVDQIHIKLPSHCAYSFIEKEQEIKTLSAEYKAAVKEVVYVVKRGDSLQRVANLYGCSVTELKDWNGLSSNLIHPGSRLKLYL
ncbi:MAG: transglycosylase SLT domain-containing protein [Flavobacteriales bacterium]|nr:transglycosylase SLT domain-containing protein [Flavobacteriales bacterium]